MLWIQITDPIGFQNLLIWGSFTLAFVGLGSLLFVMWLEERRHR